MIFSIPYSHYYSVGGPPNVDVLMVCAKSYAYAGLVAHLRVETCTCCKHFLILDPKP